MSRSNPKAKWIYDVYLSFCGKDTDKSFALDLNTALINAGVSVFTFTEDNDDKLRSDQGQIPLSVLDAIEGSRISIIIISRNYADSIWRLQELEKVMECHRTEVQMAVPVFYGVDPFSGFLVKAFERLLLAQRVLKENWRETLSEAGEIPGFTVMDSCRECRSESGVIKEAVAYVTDFLDPQQKKDLFVAKHPVGLESRVQEMIQLLMNKQHKNDRGHVLLEIRSRQRGMGATTLAKAVYNKIRGNFEATSFLSNVEEEFRNRRDASLKRRLLADIRKKSTMVGIESTSIGHDELLERGVSQKRILVVLDDVSADQFGILCGYERLLSSEASDSMVKIIIRSHHYKLCHDELEYEMRELDIGESLELFSWHAFKQERPPHDYVKLSREIVSYLKGFPLALEVLGSFLFSREKSEWKAVLKQLKRIGEPLNVLRIIYDELGPEVQSMFLEISSFFVGLDQDEVTRALNDSGYSAENGITLLEANSLITIDDDNLLRMHSVLQQMGHEIIQSESRARPEEPKVYEVFLSFRGEDTRGSFVAHLHSYLQNAGLHVFKDDDEIPRGKQISVSLLQAIGRSRIAIVVLSRNYTDSRWCMTELENIMQNCRLNNLEVVPVFYGVDPSEVRNQTGDFGKAFRDLLTRISAGSYKKNSWEKDLLEVGGRAGFVVLNSKNESEDIKRVVEGVTDLLGKTEMFVADHPVGVESCVKDVVQLLNCQQSNDVMLLGIWGMGGIGKTTIAKATYNHVHRSFEAKSFLLNVREVWEENNGEVSLQQRLLSDVYKTTKIKIDTVDSGKMILMERLRQKRLFLVLDDVNELEQLNALCGSRDWFGHGSRIIITTRDENLLRSLEVDHVCRMKEMSKKESLELFSWHAFKQPSPTDGFAELSRDVVEYCGALPLALQVIGSFLLKRGKREWKSVLKKLKVIPNDKVMAKLKISFDGLSDEDVKEIFLDIAFFFIGMDQDHIIEILKDCGHFAEIGISVLIQQSLLTIDNKNKIRMHDLLRDMGREIVRMKSKDGGECIRLWLYQDLLDELSKDMRMTALKGLTLKLATKDTSTHMKTKDFEKMKNLRLLQLAGIKLDGDYKYLSRDIRWLCWHGFPSRYTPADFHQGSLVAIELKYSKHLERVWKKSQMLLKLKFLNLSHSPNLIQTPDFSKLPNLEKLILKDCPNLSSISQTIGDLTKILLINLKDCTNLQTLPRSIYKLDSLKTLILSGCSKIDKLEEDLQQMKALTTLVADGTAITRVPFAVVNSKRIAYISLCGFEGLSRDVFPSIVLSWMSPTNSVLSFVHASSTVSSLALLDEQGSYFHGLSSVIKDLHKLQRIWVKCKSEVQLNEEVERILNILDRRHQELEEMPDTSSAFMGGGVQVIRKTSSKNFTSLLIQMGMNCHITSILRESILKKLPAIGPGLLPGNNYPNWLTFNREGSSVSFEVPEVDGRDLKTIMCIVYFSSPDNITSEGLQNVLVVNYTKATIQLYKRDGLASLEEEDEWQKVVSNIEPGDKVMITVILGNGFTVRKTTVYFIYDEAIDEKMKHCTESDKHVIALGGDETDNLKYAKFQYKASELRDIDFDLGETVIIDQNSGTPTLDVPVEPSCKNTGSDALGENVESDDGESFHDKGNKMAKGKAKLGSASVKKKTLESVLGKGDEVAKVKAKLGSTILHQLREKLQNHCFKQK